MITMQEWMAAIDYKINEGDRYMWTCYGPNAHILSSWDGEQDGHSSDIIYDTKDQTVYAVEVHDYAKGKSYRMINPDFKDAYKNENLQRDTVDEAYEGTPYIDLDVEEDWLEKATAIFRNLPYKDTVMVPLDLDKGELFRMMTLAHERDITLNQLISEVLTQAIERAEAGRGTR